MPGNNSSQSFDDWREAVDRYLQNIYCIAVVDAGVDDERLAEHWTSGETAGAFVDWFGKKYDLTSK